MEINKILKTVAELLDLPDDIVSDESSDDKCLSNLVLAFNNVLSEIAEEYIPFMKEENLSTMGGYIPFYSFSEKVYKIKSVVNQKGKKVRYTVGLKGVFTPTNGSYTVTYSYLPKSVAFGESIDVPNSVTERALSYGVAGEYALIAGRYDDCSTFDSRFNSAISSGKREMKERVLPDRGCF